jgi:hypothetical protein
MTGERLKEIYREALARRATTAERAGCPPAERLMELVARRGEEAARLATLDHVMSCPSCLGEFELLRSVDTAARRRALRPVVAVALAASAVLVIGGGLLVRSMSGPGVGPDVMRGAPSEVTLVAPVGPVDAGAPVRLVWRAAPDAWRYSLEVLDEAGNPVLSTETADTSLVLPGSVRLAANRRYTWWVRARLRDGGELRSRVEEFSLSPP